MKKKKKHFKKRVKRSQKKSRPSKKSKAAKRTRKKIRPKKSRKHAKTSSKESIAKKLKLQQKQAVQKPVKPPKKPKRDTYDDESAVGEELTLDKTPMRIYLQQIEHIPLLTADAEAALAEKIFHGGEESKEARLKMIRSNLRLVISIAKRYSNIGLPFSDLVEEGNIGLMRAVDKFNYKRGYRFSTYASWWIKQAIMRALSNQGKTIRVPVYMYDIISKWRKVRDGLTQKLGRNPTRKEISDAMGVSIRKVKEVERIASQPSSLNAPVSIDGSAEVIDLVEDAGAVSASENVQELFTAERVDQLLSLVDERARQILVMRFGLKGSDSKTLEETAQQFNITRERVRQIESASLKKIREHLDQKEEKLHDYLTNN